MLSNTINRIWLVLIAATFVTFWLGESGLSGTGLLPVLVMFGLAYMKGMLVILHFMELRHAPFMWRALMVGWLTLIVVVIVGAYLAGGVARA